MGLTSATLLWLLVAATAATPLALVWLWRRLMTPWRAPVMVLGVVLAQALAVATVAVGVNRAYGFYPTWGSLVGQVSPAPPAPLPQEPAARNGTGEMRVRAASLQVAAALRPPPSGPHADTLGTVRHFLVTGVASHLTRRVTVWLPPGFGTTAMRHHVYPVEMMMAGAYSHVDRMVHDLDVRHVFGPEVASGRVPPFIAVFPEVNVAWPQDTECIDDPHGAKAWTWLAQDVPNWVQHHFPVSSAARDWNASGWSLGAYCAVKLQVLDPRRFGSAVAVEGFFAPELDQTTGDLARVLARDPSLAHASSPLWMAQHRLLRSAHILVMSSPTDPQSYDRSRAFVAAARESGVQLYLVPEQGHTVEAWQVTLPQVQRWASAVAASA